MMEHELPSQPGVYRLAEKNLTSRASHYAPYFLGLFLFCLPIVLAWLWGTQFEDNLYPMLRYAYNLSLGRGWGYEATIPGQVLPESPLTITLLSLFASPDTLSTLSLTFSALGWSLTGLLIWYSGIRQQKGVWVFLTAVLLLSHPLVVVTLGGAASWGIGAGYLAIWAWSQTETKTRPKTAILLLLLLLHFDLAALTLVGWLWLTNYARQRRPVWFSILPVLLWAVLWSVFLFVSFGRVVALPTTNWPYQLPLLLRHSQLYWLFLPFLIAGGYSFIRQPTQNRWLWGWFIWCVATVLTGSSLAVPVAVTTGLMLTALGFAALWQGWTQRQNSPLPVYVAGAVAGLLLVPQLSSTYLTYLAHGTQNSAEAQVVAWLQENTTAETQLFANPRLGYLADRPTLSAYPLPQTAEQWAVRFADLIAAAPDYLIIPQSGDWYPLTASGWVTDRYQEVAQFNIPYSPDASYRVYRYMPSPFDNDVIQPATVIVDEAVKLVAYAYQPATIQPGDDIYVTLYLETLKPVGLGYFTRLHLAHTQDDWVWAWNQVLSPHTISGLWWQPGQVIPERIKLEVEENIPWGAYELQVLWQRTYQEGPRPLYQNEDTNALDRVLLGYVVAVPPVDSSQMQSVNGRFGDQIQLSGMNLQSDFTPGSPLTVSLYWEALRVPEADYTVFVHLLNEAGEWVAGQDGRPMDGRYTTLAWQSGHLIQDDHPLTLPANLPAGNYQIKVGLYRLETGERLPVWNAQNEEQPERSLFLTSIEVKP